MLELIEAGWDFSILKPRRLESRPYNAGALTYSSSGGNVSGFPCPRGSPEQGKGGMRGHAPFICRYVCHLELLGTSLPSRLLEPAISDRSLTPAGAGTLPYENWGCWLVEEFEGDWGHSRLPWIPDCVGMTRAGELWTAMAGFDGRLADRPRLGTSPSATFLLRPWAVVVRATAVGVAGRWRNRSRIGVRDMLSYQLWENALTPALRATYNFPGPPYL